MTFSKVKSPPTRESTDHHESPGGGILKMHFSVVSEQNVQPC